MLDRASTMDGDLTEPGDVACLKIEAAIRSVLIAIGEDPTREGLLDTPGRAARMYLEVFSGLFEDPYKHFETQFSTDTRNGMVVVKDMHFYSMCEHHLLPFFGKVHIAYLPENNRVAGLSKFARVVETLSRRPQMQERLTSMIAEVVTTKLDPRGVVVVVEAEHMCMAMRGIRSERATTTTLVATGVFEDNPLRRNEALSLINSSVTSSSHGEGARCHCSTDAGTH